ncbi:MAG: helix-turn-helix domain-containing protein [Hyphomonadaceae bacterium]
MLATSSQPVVLAVSPAEAARLLGIGRTRLYEELGSGAIPSFHLGRRRLIRVAALEAWMAAREAGK